MAMTTDQPRWPDSHEALIMRACVGGGRGRGERILLPLGEYHLGNLLGLLKRSQHCDNGDWYSEMIQLIQSAMEQLNIQELHSNAGDIFRQGNLEAQVRSIKKRRHKVTLCGSTRFEEAYRAANRDETLKGHIVMSVGLLGHKEGIDMDDPLKAMLDELHLSKIDECDDVLVLNCDGYVGKSTRNEIVYAIKNDKPVRYLEPIPGQEVHQAVLKELGLSNV